MDERRLTPTRPPASPLPDASLEGSAWSRPVSFYSGTTLRKSKALRVNREQYMARIRLDSPDSLLLR